MSTVLAVVLVGVAYVSSMLTVGAIRVLVGLVVAGPRAAEEAYARAQADVAAL